MINLDFETSKISTLLQTIDSFKNILYREKNGIENKYFTGPAKSNSFFKLITDKLKLYKILTQNELYACREMTEKKSFNGRDFVTIILDCGYEVLSDENFEKTFNTCLSEWKEYFEEEKKRTPSERHSQYTDEQITYSLDNIYHMLYKQQTFINALQKLMATEEFQDLYNTTLNYRKELESNWNANKEEISEFISKVTGIQAEGSSKVMVLPPLFDNGFTTRNGIYYSRCHDDRKNHDLMELVYLTHESMHSHVLPYLMDQEEETEKKLHGFIQYLCDNELFSRLASKRGVDYQYGENQQHDIDDKTFANMYPFFVGYLYRNEENPVKCILYNMIKNKKYHTIENKTGKHIVLMYSPDKIAQLFQGKKDLSPYDFARINFNLAEKLFGIKNENKNKARKEFE